MTIRPPIFPDDNPSDRGRPTRLSVLDHASVGRPISRLGVQLFPVYLHQGPTPLIRTGEGAGVVVEELDDAEVPTLSATNAATDPVLLVEGETVKGGQQHRTLNVTVLVPAGSTVRIPVSCVEAGRWQYGQRGFGRGRVHTTRRVRVAKNLGVAQSRTRGSRASDQGAVWDAVNDELQLRLASSPTAAYLDLDDDERHDERYQRAVRSLLRRGPLPGQSGVVIAHAGKILGAEVFGSTDLLAAQWEALVRTALLEATEGTGTARRCSTDAALDFLARAARLPGSEFEGVALGRERHVGDDHIVGQALVWEDLLVHGSAFALAA